MIPVKVLRTPTSFHSVPIRELYRNKLVGVTIGNFDALHLGHQRLFQVLESELSERPPEERLRVLITFWPHPRRVLSGIKRAELPSRPEFFTVCSLRQKLALIAGYGFDICYLIHFRRELAALAPEEFVSRHIAGACRPSVVVIGDDWAFGKGRAGNPEMLSSLGKSHGYRVKVVPAEEYGGKRVSTSIVKDAVARADFAQLRKILGREYALDGRVRPGDKRGRELGFPTANIECPGVILPPDGIYAGFADVDGRRRPAAIYIGHRPTFGRGHKVIETHLIDESGIDLYGKRLGVEFIALLRGDSEFANESDLVEAIRNDVARARELLRTS